MWHNLIVSDRIYIKSYNVEKVHGLRRNAKYVILKFDNGKKLYISYGPMDFCDFLDHKFVYVKNYLKFGL